MPNDTLTQALKEAYSQASQDVTIFDTLEIVSGVASSEVDRIDVAFVLDLSGSMDSELLWLKNALPNLFVDLKEQFRVVRFALTTYGESANNGNPTIQSTFVTDPASIVDILDGLTTSGSREPVFDTLSLTLDALNWSNFYGTTRSIVCITDEPGEDSGQTATEETVLADLNSNGVTLHQTYSQNANNALFRMMEATRGSFIRRDNEANFNEDTLEALKSVVVVDPNLEPIYMIQNPEGKTLTLENGKDADFEPVGFRFQLPGQSDRGVSELSIAIDNVDQRVGSFVQSALAYEAPILVRYRPYLSNDTSQPQQDPPLELVLSDLKIDPFEVTGRATFADIVNLKFLTEYYTRQRFPSLGNT